MQPFAYTNVLYCAQIQQSHTLRTQTIMRLHIPSLLEPLFITVRMLFDVKCMYNVGYIYSLVLLCSLIIIFKVLQRMKYIRRYNLTWIFTEKQVGTYGLRRECAKRLARYGFWRIFCCRLLMVNILIVFQKQAALSTTSLEGSNSLHFYDLPLFLVIQTAKIHI